MNAPLDQQATVVEVKQISDAIFRPYRKVNDLDDRVSRIDQNAKKCSGDNGNGGHDCFVLLYILSCLGFVLQSSRVFVCEYPSE